MVPPCALTHSHSCRYTIGTPWRTVGAKPWQLQGEPCFQVCASRTTIDCCAQSGQGCAMWGPQTAQAMPRPPRSLQEESCGLHVGLYRSVSDFDRCVQHEQTVTPASAQLEGHPSQETRRRCEQDATAEAGSPCPDVLVDFDVHLDRCPSQPQEAATPIDHVEETVAPDVLSQAARGLELMWLSACWRPPAEKAQPAAGPSPQPPAHAHAGAAAQPAPAPAAMESLVDAPAGDHWHKVSHHSKPHAPMHAPLFFAVALRHCWL